MKKIRLITLLTLTLTFTLLLLVGCKKDDKIASLSLKDNDPNTAVEIAVGGFDYGAYTVIVTYESGNTEEIPLTEDMIAAVDQVKLYQAGDHDITVSYGEKKYTFKVSVKNNTFEDLCFPENNVFTYDGKAHGVEVEGNIPANAVVTYPGGNSFVNAGTYDVTAIVSCDGYVTARLSTTVTIQRAKYDMSDVKFEAKEFVYDGTAHSVAISGTLPKGVSLPTYSINEKETASATDVGEYTVKATFANNNPNYETIPDMVTTLKITQAEYNVKGIDIVFKNEDGKTIDGAAKVYDGKSITFDLNDYSKLPKNVSVSFSVTDKDGKVISTSNKNTGIKNAGVYTVLVEFTPADSKNYKPIAPIVCEFEVITAEYPAIENIEFLSSQVTYDGNAHSVAIFGTLPEGVAVSYEYYLNNSLVIDSEGKAVQSVTDAGRYTVKAIFTHTDENRGTIPALTTILNIDKIYADSTLFGFFGASSIEYSGTAYEPDFLTWQEANGTQYDVLKYSQIKYYVFDTTGEKYIELGEDQLPIEIGMYRASVTASIADEYANNYGFRGGQNSMEITSDFNIVRKKTAAPRVTFNGNPNVEYTGAAQEIAFTPQINSELMTITTAYFSHTSNGYVAMESSQVPINAGNYRFVVTVSINEGVRHLYVLPNGENTAEFSFDFEIQKKIIDVPEFSFDNTELVYNGNNQAVDFDCSVISEFITITEAYYRLEGEAYVAMGENEIPLHAGSYKLVVTASINDELNCAFSNGEMRAEASFEFVINKSVIELSAMGYVGNSVSSGAYRPDFKNYLDDFQKSAVSGYEQLVRRGDDNGWSGVSDGVAQEPGQYEFRYTVRITDTDNFIFSDLTTETVYVFSLEMK